MGRVLALVVVLLVAGVLASCGHGSVSGTANANANANAKANGDAKANAYAKANASAREVGSNVLHADYAGTRACENCHAGIVKSWLASPMHNMTREAAGAVIHGPFDGTTFRFKDDTAKLEMDRGARFVTLDSKKFGKGTFRVTRVIGGHHREDYAGAQVAAPYADAAVPAHADELVLPVSWVFGRTPGEKGALRYKGYSVMVKERTGLRAGPVWNQTCIFCHNTPTYLSTVLGALAGPGARPYQGEVVDPLMPRDRRAKWTVTSESALAGALGVELARLGSKRSHPTVLEAIDVTRSAYRPEHLVEVGIGCEACHLGSAEHVRNPRRLPSFEPRSALFEVKWPLKTAAAEELRATRINRVCARCHQVLFSGYEPTWEGGSRRGNAGGSHINSGEARDMMLGACSTRLSCVDCHDIHAADATARLRALTGVAQDALCTKCHERYTSPAALREHTHHEPAGEGARCLSCHMAKKNLALDGSLSRYHRIGSPNDPQRVLLDRPMECALCHADKSAESLATTMETWWKRPFDREVLRKLYGAPDANVMLATAERGKPHEQAVAFFVLGETTMEPLKKQAIPVLASQLTHPYPLVRGYAKRGLDSLMGAVVSIDIDADDAAIEAAAKKLR